MAMRLLPMGVLTLLERIMRNFYQKGNFDNGRCGFRLISWDNIRLPKEGGGLDFRNVHYFNTALVMKAYWELLITIMVRLLFGVHLFIL